MDACIEYNKEGDHDKLLLIGYQIALLQNLYGNEYENRIGHRSKKDIYLNNLVKEYIGFKYVGIKDENFDYYVEQYGLPFDLYLGYEEEYNDYFKNKKTNTEKYKEIGNLFHKVQNDLKTALEKYEKCEEFIRGVIIKLCKNPYPWSIDTVNFIKENRLLLSVYYYIANPENKIIHDNELKKQEREFEKLLVEWQKEGKLDPNPYRPRVDSGRRYLKGKSKVRKSTRKASKKLRRKLSNKSRRKGSKRLRRKSIRRR